MSNIQDVAKIAGVSVATVSRVLNESSAVTEKTRDAVYDAINRLNYTPNLLGRNLRRTRTNLVLVLLPNISNPFYGAVVKGIEDVAHKNGYNIMLCNTDSSVTREKIYLDMLKNKLADGVIFMAPEMGPDELSEIAKSFPVVQCSEYRLGARASHVSIDNTVAAYKAVKHLIGLGHKRIGMLSSAKAFVSTKQREEGYKKAIAEAGIMFEDELISRGDYGYKSGLRYGYHMITMKDRPTAVFAISDVMAVGVVRASIENGLKIPDDMAVIGFDNISFSTMYKPSITTISQPRYDIGCSAMELLLKQIKEETKEPIGLILEHELIIRESTVR